MKRITFFYFAFGVLILGFAGLLSAQTVSFPDTTAAPGSTILIPIYTTEIDPSDSVQSFDVQINYDESVAVYSDYDITGAILPTSWFTIFYSSAPGVLNGGSFMTSSPYLSGEGVLIYLEYNIPETATGTTPLTLVSFYYNEDLMTTIDGSITIEVGLPTVNGYAFLENQTSHEDIEVFFEAISGGAVSATTYTEDSGSYELDVMPGTYDIHYSHPGFETVTVSDVGITVSVTLDDVTLPEILTAAINGYAFLEGQTSHAGIQVLFQADGPGSVTDTTWTAADGSYSIDIIQGMYDVYYYYTGYGLCVLEDQDLTFAQSLPDVTLPDIPSFVYVAMPDTTIYETGLSVEIPIYITYVSPFHNVLSYDFYLSFDPEIAVAASPVYDISGTITPAAWISTYDTSTPGVISGGAISFDSLNVMTGEGVMVKMRFYIPENAVGTTPLEFAYVLFSEGSTIMPDHFDGALTVLGGGVNEIPSNTIPGDFALGQNYPNPFNPTTTIEFALPHSSKAHLAVYNLLGSEVGVLANQTLDAGRYSVIFNAEGLPSGFYFYRLTADDFVQTRKCLLVE